MPSCHSFDRAPVRCTSAVGAAEIFGAEVRNFTGVQNKIGADSHLPVASEHANVIYHTLYVVWVREAGKWVRWRTRRGQRSTLCTLPAFSRERGTGTKHALASRVPRDFGSGKEHCVGLVRSKSGAQLREYELFAFLRTLMRKSRKVEIVQLYITE